MKNEEKDLQNNISFAKAARQLRNELESDEDTLEPFDDQDEHRKINAADPADLTKWAKEFQISEADLKAAIMLNGNGIREIKKYLSI
ncbi:MAG: DUF3606 domain-containing protein [Pedobacter sp.]|nr:MAG: DUF3606 domain-containing protein [Pedobacter sp.]